MDRFNTKQTIRVMEFMDRIYAKRESGVETKYRIHPDKIFGVSLLLPREGEKKISYRRERPGYLVH